MSARRSFRIQFGLIDKIDGLLVVFAGASAVWLAYLLLTESVKFGWQTLLLLGFWPLFTYLILPRLHRILTHIYVPGYFIGRTRTSDGLLGDPVNLAWRGNEAEIHAVLGAAGWTRADDLTLRTAGRIVRSTLGRRSYPHAPVSPLLLFDRQQDFAYQQEVSGNPAKRHHVRFWRCPGGWLLPGGFAVDWLAAGTYDRSVGLSLFTLQITHKIEENTDIERDFIVSSVTSASPEVTVRIIDNFSSGYHSRNGGGDVIQTDGDLPVVDVRPVDLPELPPVALTDSRDKRPAQLVFGSGVALIRALGYLVIALAIAVVPLQEFELEADNDITNPTELEIVRWVLFAVVMIFALADIGLGLATLAGRNWARMLLMLSSVIATVSAFVGSLAGEAVTLATNLPTVALSILVLLGLSSHRSREYAVRGRHQPKRVHAAPEPDALLAGPH